MPEIGTREGLRTEFKRAEKLRTPKGRQDIARTVVAMRNAEGGSIWIGVREEDEVLVGLEPLLEEDHLARTSLRDLLLDCIEPLLALGREVRMEPIEVASGWALHIRVDAVGKSAPPCCYVSGNKREFLVRSDGRNSVLPYARIVGERSSSSTFERVPEIHREWSTEFAEHAGLAISAVPEQCPDDHEELTFPPTWRQAIEQPTPEIARPRGWTWSPGAYGEYVSLRNVLHARAERMGAPYLRLKLHATGQLHFFTSLSNLVWKENERVCEAFPGGVSGQLYPYALAETVASTIRLVACLVKLEEHRFARSGRIGLIATIDRGRGWVIPRYGADTYGWLLHSEGRDAWSRLPTDEVSTGLLVRSAEDLGEEPDRLSYVMLRRLYESDPEGAEMKHVPWFENEFTFAPPA